MAIFIFILQTIAQFSSTATAAVEYTISEWFFFFRFF